MRPGDVRRCGSACFWPPLPRTCRASHQALRGLTCLAPSPLITNETAACGAIGQKIFKPRQPCQTPGARRGPAGRSRALVSGTAMWGRSDQADAQPSDGCSCPSVAEGNGLPAVATPLLTVTTTNWPGLMSSEVLQGLLPAALEYEATTVFCGVLLL